MTVRKMPVVQNPDTVIQRLMNLVMPLSDPSPQGKARLTLELASYRSAIDTALNNVSTLHFARFNITGTYLSMISVYDGGAHTYIREIALQLGDAFDVVLHHIADWPPATAERGRDLRRLGREGEDDNSVTRQGTSVAENPDLFVEWALAHDIEQLPRNPVELLPDRDEDAALPVTLDVELYQQLVRRFAEQEHLHLSAYRGYAGATVAAIRDGLRMGW